MNEITCLACKGEGLDEKGEYCQECGGSGVIAADHDDQEQL